ncbi:LysM peptidoglycan-binding domain-containing protein [Ornithinibacillus scapharcae]|uniref:C40 family peptidase n=1 Tax=Ornithinibacillus scapharcae TaxID=1147159 RepID=UPI000225B425|nr:peptidoglycan endopeptidase [Ornithinibacillus scapharcae]
MANKKIYMSVAATAFIASALFGIEEAEASSTYKVQSGDSLWKIAQKHNITISQLKSLNNLTTEIIFPNQVLKTQKDLPNNKTSNKTESTKEKPKQTASPNTTSKITYTVKSGDTLSAIASKHKVSLSNLIQWNNLNTTLIYPGNVLVINKSVYTEKQNNTLKPETEKPINTNPISTKGYTVKSGDTLSKIASQYGVTIADLKKWNKLNSDMIYIGQKLHIGDSVNVETPNVTTPIVETPSSDISYNINQLINVAKDQLGIGYAWGGSSPLGFDCSGFIYYAYKEAGLDISRYSSEGYHMRSYYVDMPKVGDLVFFENTYQAGISHVGIYLGNNEFIHASSDAGVMISSLDQAYWKKHFEGFKRFY